MVGELLQLRFPSAPDVWSFCTSLPAALRAAPLAWRAVVLGGYAVASAIWIFFFVGSQPVGPQRFVPALLVTTGHCLTPLLINAKAEPLVMISVVFAFGLSIMKVITSCRAQFEIYWVVVCTEVLETVCQKGDSIQRTSLRALQRGAIIQNAEQKLGYN